MNIHKWVGVTGAAVLLSLTLGACGSSSGTDEGGSGDLTVGLLMPVTSGASYTTSYVEAFKEKADELGVKVKVYDAKLSASTQASQADELFAQKPDAVVLQPAAADAAAPIIAKANALKIPISISNNEVSPELLDKALFYTGPANEKQGEAAAELLAKAMGGTGNVIVIGGAAGQPVTDAREAGLQSKLAEIAPDIKVLGEQPADWDKVKAISVATSLLTKYNGQVGGIFAMSDDMAVGASQARDSAGFSADEVPIVGVGFSESGLAGITDGSLYGTVRQSARDDGAYAIENLVRSLKGESVEKETYIPSEPITAENADQYKPDWS